MGQSSSSQLLIKNVCENMIKQTNEQLAKLVSQSSSNITNTIVQEQKAAVSSSSGAGNTAILSNITVKNEGEINITQQNELKSTVQAVLNITQSSDITNQLTSKIKDDIMSAVSQDGDMQNKIKAVAEMNKEKKTSGELNNFVDKVGEVLGNLTKLGSSTEDITQIQNTILNSMDFSNVTRTDIENYISSVVNTSVTQTTINDCFKTTSAYNTITMTNLTVDGGKINVIQKNTVDDYFSCIVSSSLSSSELQQLSNEMIAQTKMTASQGAGIKNDFDSSLKNIQKNIVTSFADNIQFVIIAIVICVVLGAALLIGGPIIFLMLKKKSAPSGYANPSMPESTNIASSKSGYKPKII